METQSNVPGSMNPITPPINPNPGQSSQGFMGTLEYYLVTKAPFQFPVGLKEFIVKFGPWINLIFLLTLVPLLLMVLGVGTRFSMFLGPQVFYGWSVHVILALITLAMSVMALPGLFRRKMSGWNMTFYVVIISFVGNILAGNLVGGLISAIVSLYVLFQVKSYYN